ncbi:hypothetical protein [Cystobacter ferrugineus]|uniref:Uncharacterized protein n=1 Tax=Cystobacter ferrugineus TaxID=83449 RepID=A0A1L9BHP9_9BACT|nr:hypothetical protein [Cystobacter ferrugineus]OJH41736.1 hypothetical protein BON30_00355 [Cystobacter ferrugineus]
MPTTTENEAHRATLGETKCSDCMIGLLKQYTSESLRAQKKLDPSNQKYHLQDNEEIEFLRAKPLTLQLVGLRRERSISNKFDDLMVVLYDPALLKEGEKTVLEDPDLRQENLPSAQGYVDKILADKKRPPQKDWPLPGTDVSCLQCMHWRVLTFPITTEPGYDPKAPHTKKDAQGKQLPNFDDLSLLPDEVGAVAPGIYNNSYRVGLHLGTRKPPNSFAALQLVPDSIPARRRYPIGRFLKRAESAFNKGTDDDIRKALIRKDAKAQKELIASIQEEFKEMKRGTKAEKAAFDKAVKEELDARNRETYAPRILELRTNAARAVLNALKARIGKNERYIRLEAPSGAETQDFAKEGNQISSMEVADDDTSPIRVCVRLVFESSPPTSSPPTAAPAAPPASITAKPSAAVASASPSAAVGASATTPPPPRTLTLTKDDVLVTFGTAAGTNMHRSVSEEEGAWRKNREVNNWSEGCQVFRSPNDFRHFMRMAMLSKRVHCPSRTDKCGRTLTVEDVEKGIGENMTTYINGCPNEFAKLANSALQTGFSPPTPVDTSASNEPKATATPDAKKLRDAVEKLFAESKANQEFTNQVGKAYWKQFPSEEYYNKNTYSLLQDYAREKVLSALSDKSTEEDIKKAVDAGIEEFTKKLTETKDGWVKSVYVKQIELKHAQYLEDGLEPCDFGTCGFKFDYMLAETTRTNMEAFVSRLGDRDWNSLYPQDAPPPAPKPPKPAAPRAKAPAK